MRDSIVVLLKEFGRSIKNLDCRISQNTLQLNGIAKSFYEKQKLQERAKKLGHTVDNRVRVE